MGVGGCFGFGLCYNNCICFGRCFVYWVVLWIIVFVLGGALCFGGRLKS